MTLFTRRGLKTGDGALSCGNHQIGGRDKTIGGISGTAAFAAFRAMAVDDGLYRTPYFQPDLFAQTTSLIHPVFSIGKRNGNPGGETGSASQPRQR